MTSSSPESMRDLIEMNRKLAQQDSGVGLFAQAKAFMETRPIDYENLGLWDLALAEYTVQEQDTKVLTGQLRCFDALRDWRNATRIMAKLWPSADTSQRSRLATYGANAAWAHADFAAIRTFTQAMKPSTEDHAFWSAVLAVHDGDIAACALNVGLARNFVDDRLKMLLKDSYGTSYKTLVRNQVLVELEEAASVKEDSRFDEGDGRLRTVIRSFNDRLANISEEFDSWSDLLRVHAFVIKPQDHAVAWTKLANICRLNKRFTMAKEVLDGLLHTTMAPDGSIVSSKLFPHLDVSSVLICLIHA